MPDFLLPDLGEGLTEAEIIAWRVRAGDRVAVDQVIAEVETAKAVVEVPVPYAGVVAALHAEPGTVVQVGQPLITVTADEPEAVRPAPEASGEDTSGEEASGSVLIGYGTTTAPPRTRRNRVAVVSPLVRREARDAGLDLARLTGTGPAGAVSRRDIRQAIAARAGITEAATTDTGTALAGTAGAGTAEASTAKTGTAKTGTAKTGTAETSTAGTGTAGGGERRIALRGVRRAAADQLTRSRREIPEATVWVDVDATGLVEARRALNAADPARPVSLVALLARFALLGLRRYPELNARIEGDEIIIPDRVHLGFAAQTGHGLVVPVVADAHRLTTRELSARLAERTAAARERRLAPADLSGGTFTVNNYGVFGVDGSAAIINHPQVAILGLGRVIDRPWVAGGQLTVRQVAELTLAFDHRACDGGTAGGFLRYVADLIESPATALGDL
jgi:2-oxoisovalerate dehydrogenase E2 component (dihydrolipoyl transacylase)